MVNINQINEISQAMGSTAQAKPRANGPGQGFQSLLDTAIDRSGAMEDTTGPAPLGEISSPGFQLEDPATLVVNQTDRLLGLLETYAGQLETPGISLKQIAPVMEEINENAGDLLKETRFLGTESDDLKTIATQTVVTARTEYEKFQRGDYLS